MAALKGQLLGLHRPIVYALSTTTGAGILYLIYNYGNPIEDGIYPRFRPYFYVSVYFFSFLYSVDILHGIAVKKGRVIAIIGLLIYAFICSSILHIIGLSFGVLDLIDSHQFVRPFIFTLYGFLFTCALLAMFILYSFIYGKFASKRVDRE